MRPVLQKRVEEDAPEVLLGLWLNGPRKMWRHVAIIAWRYGRLSQLIKGSWWAMDRYVEEKPESSPWWLRTIVGTARTGRSLLKTILRRRG